jgi:SNF2 family DNA or RNA helicase
MNSFLSGVRQISNSTRGYDVKHSPEESKIDTAFERLSGRMAKDPGHKAIVYSNYLNSGISPYREKLTKAGIPFGEYTGEIKKKDRDQLVRDYNSGKKKVILMTSAAGEGLDLKGTGSAQILEPHFNLEKIRQVEGRAIRYGSHASMPKDKRNVLVENFIATRRPGVLAKLGLTNPAKGVDEYLGMMSKNKEELNSKFRNILEQNK